VDYNLNTLKKTVTNHPMSEDQKRILNQKMWNIANTLRGKMNPDEFRDYILEFIFYKYLSERIEIYADEILEKEEKINFKNLKEKTSKNLEYIKKIKKNALESLGYFLEPSELFSEIIQRSKSDSNAFILDDLQKILINIELRTMNNQSKKDFENLFEDMDLNSTKLGKTPDARNEIIIKILTHLNEIDFNLKNTEHDILGNAYEYLIGQFASGAGKKSGEFYTPQQVSTILAKIVINNKTFLKSVYDPTCGSGSLLLRVIKEIGAENVNKFYGQEMNRTTYNLARMNMIMNGVCYNKFDIKQEDTLEHPQHLDQKFEAIVANPPFSAKWSADPLFLNDKRFSEYGKLAPASKADFAFVQHMVFHLADNGTMAIVLPHGVLFRGSAELHIRKYLIEKNYLDTIIGLPPNIFYSTTIPTCILVFKKYRKDFKNILFIDASREFEKTKTQNLLRNNHINKIVDTYSNRAQIKKYSHLASLEEIKNNDYNLNISRYVDTFEEEEEVDIHVVMQEIKNLEAKRAELDQQINDYLKELGLVF